MESSLKCGFMKQATIAEVQVALQNLLAHFEPPDDYLTNYTTSVWRELKARINFRKNVQKWKKFKEMIRGGITDHYKYATSKLSLV